MSNLNYDTPGKDTRECLSQSSASRDHRRIREARGSHDQTPSDRIWRFSIDTCATWLHGQTALSRAGVDGPISSSIGVGARWRPTPLTPLKQQVHTNVLLITRGSLVSHVPARESSPFEVGVNF